MAICCLNSTQLFQRVSHTKINFSLYFSLLQRYFMCIITITIRG